MTKRTTAAIAAPTILEHGVTDAAIARNLRVVDAGTGEEIAGVIAANADTGRVRRYEVVGGNLVRDGDAFEVVEEDQAVRLEWIDPPVPAGEQPDAEDAG